MWKKELFRSIIKQTLIWGLAFTFWSLLRNYGHDVNLKIPEPTLVQWIRIQVVLAIAAGITFGSISYIYENVLFGKMKFGLYSLLASFSYLLAIVLVISVGTGVFTRVLDLPKQPHFLNDFILSKTGLLFIVYCFVVGILVDIFHEINRKFGPGNLMRMIRGDFYSPKEDERILLFIDLRSSTTYAETLGHIKFSRLIQDCFSDLNPVIKFGAEIYQYVGDEVVLSWPVEKGLENSNCIRAFFAYIKRLEGRSGYYNMTYGFVPEFKAGINIGKITVAEVGDIKREIAYHGDVLNTAARIQGMCNQLGEQFLASEDLVNQLGTAEPYVIREAGKVQLRGKQSEEYIFSINEN